MAIKELGFFCCKTTMKNERLKCVFEATATKVKWYQVEHATFSEMLSLMILD